MCTAATVARHYLDFSANLSGPFSATFVQNKGPYLCLQNIFLTSPLSFFLQSFPPPGNMDCCLPCNRSAAHIVQLQDLELILLLRLIQHGSRRARKEREEFASLRPAETFMRACMRPTEAACCRTIRIRSLFPCHTYTQKCCVRYMYIRKQ